MSTSRVSVSCSLSTPTFIRKKLYDGLISATNFPVDVMLESKDSGNLDLQALRKILLVFLSLIIETSQIALESISQRLGLMKHNNTLVVVKNIHDYNRFLVSVKDFKPSKHQDTFLEFAQEEENLSEMTPLPRSRLKDLVNTRSLFMLPDPAESISFITRKGRLNFKIRSKSNSGFSMEDLQLHKNNSRPSSTTPAQRLTVKGDLTKKTIGSGELKPFARSKTASICNSDKKGTKSKDDKALAFCQTKFPKFETPSMYKTMSKTGSTGLRIKCCNEPSLKDQPTNKGVSSKNDNHHNKYQLKDPLIKVRSKKVKRERPLHSSNISHSTMLERGQDMKPFSSMKISKNSSEFENAPVSLQDLGLENSICSLVLENDKELRDSPSQSGRGSQANEPRLSSELFGSAKQSQNLLTNQTVKPSSGNSRPASISKFSLQAPSKKGSGISVDLSNDKVSSQTLHQDFLELDTPTLQTSKSRSHKNHKMGDSSLRRIVIDPAMKAKKGGDSELESPLLPNRRTSDCQLLVIQLPNAITESTQYYLDNSHRQVQPARQQALLIASP